MRKKSPTCNCIKRPCEDRAAAAAAAFLESKPSPEGVIFKLSELIARLSTTDGLIIAASIRNATTCVIASSVIPRSLTAVSFARNEKTHANTRAV